MNYDIKFKRRVDSGSIDFFPDDERVNRFHKYKSYRPNGPSMISPNGHEGWFNFHRIHREDGPTIIFPDGSKNTEYTNTKVDQT